MFGKKSRKMIVLAAVVVFLLALAFGVIDLPFCYKACNGFECESLTPLSFIRGCPAVHRLGDECRRFMSCEYVFFQCQPVKAPDFDKCLSCVEKCAEIGWDKPQEMHKCPQNCLEGLDHAATCLMISNQEQRDICYSTAIHYQKDESICDKMDGSYWKGNYLKNQCYLEVSKAKNNKSLCNKITDLPTKTTCYGEELTLEVCEQTEDESSRGLCFKSIAVNNRDPEICERISHQNYHDECISMIVAYTRNMDLCERVIGSQKKEWCYEPDMHFPTSVFPPD